MKQYLKLCKTVLEKGFLRKNRTQTNAFSIFGYQMRFQLSKGFPLLTTKKVFFKAIVHELL
jgi:thymidylate synthase